MEMLLAFAKKGKAGSALGSVSAGEFKSEIKNHTPTKADAKDARKSFDRNYPNK